jgi:hypothetical protein
MAAAAPNETTTAAATNSDQNWLIATPAHTRAMAVAAAPAPESDSLLGAVLAAFRNPPLATVTPHTPLPLAVAAALADLGFLAPATVSPSAR